jgi:polysaccharide deacetylase 2 family uncharacterized protein YibQ
MPKRRMILRKRDATLQGAGAVFWLLLLVAVAVGGERALSGLPALLDILAPPGLMAARAENAPPPPRTVRLDLTERFSASPYAPQWLFPVSSQAYPAWLARRAGLGQADAAPAPAAGGPVIAIVIDDLGDDSDAARRAIALPAAVSLSFLPYPAATPALARAAERAGHQVLVHVPMEPDGTTDPGPNALLTALAAPELTRRLDWALSRVPGYAGINNHEGSRFTADRAALIPVMEDLAGRHVFFLDSRTSPASVVVPLARAFGVPSAARDVFLDDVQTPQAIAAALETAQSLARRNGVAIAIGHPHAATLAALALWCAHRGDLVPVSAAIRLKTEREALAVAAH